MADSAGVILNRVDRSQVPVDALPGAINTAAAISSERGFINRVYNIQNQKQLRTTFGDKDFRKYGTSMHSVDKYLQSRNVGFIVRAGDPTWLIASVLFDKPAAYSPQDPLDAVAAGVLQADTDVFVTDDLVRIFAMGEGEWGNDISILGEVVPATEVSFENVDQLALSKITVFKGGVLPANIVETFIVSRRPQDRDAVGNTLYIVDVLATSEFIAATDNTSQLEDQIAIIFPIIALAGGTTLVAVTETQYIDALEQITLLPETFDVLVTLNAGSEIDHANFSSIIDANEKTLGITALKRNDAVATNATVNVVDLAAARGGVATANSNTYQSSNFLMTFLAQWVTTLEDESGQNIFIDPSGYLALVIAQQTNNSQFAYAPAGIRRGQFSGALGISRDFSGNDRKALADAQIVPIKSDKDGIVPWEELTTQTFKSAFSNTHVALSYLAMIRSIPESLKSFPFEFNDQNTVDAILNILDTLADEFVEAKAAQQIVVTDEDNVIGETSIKIKWNVRFKEVARFIQVDIVAQPTNQDINVSLATA